MEFPLGPRCAPSGPAVPGATCGCSGGRDPRADLRPRPPYSPATPGLETRIVVAGRTDLVKLGCSLEREEKKKKKSRSWKVIQSGGFRNGPLLPAPRPQAAGPSARRGGQALGGGPALAFAVTPTAGRPGAGSSLQTGRG